jgi:malonate transporter and related proteins
MIATIGTLLPAFIVIGASAWAGKRVLTPDSIKALSALTFTLLMPALLFRSTLNFHFDPQYARALAGYYLPSLALWAAVTFFLIRAKKSPLANSATVGVAASFSNTVQLGIPLTTLAFGQAGLGILLALIALHALTLITVASVAVEMNIARKASQSMWGSIAQTIKAAIVHPVILPILAGLAGSYAGLTLPIWLDTALKYLADAAGPLCLVLLGGQLSHISFGKTFVPAAQISCVKLIIHPLIVGVSLWVMGVRGLPLGVLTTVAALPVGTNAFLFAQRYETDVETITTSIALSTLACLITYTLVLSAVRSL